MKENAEQFTIILYYKYTSVEKPEHLAMWHRGICGALGFKGRILIAPEGINGTLEGKTKDVESYMEALKKLSLSRDTRGMGNFRNVQFKRSIGTGNAFPKMKIKVKSEIVSVKLDEEVNPNVVTGRHLPATELKRWYEKGEDFVVVDMRNDYEFKVGHFKDSINPDLENSRDLPKAVAKLEHLKDKKILTVCTGGIRCEKMSGYLLKKGFKDVYQLDGGMHSYMEKYPGEDFKGTLYTFDNRVVMDFGGDREIIGKCEKCNETSERYANCADPVCHKHIVCCEKCSEENGEVFCSDSCRDKILIKK